MRRNSSRGYRNDHGSDRSNNAEESQLQVLDMELKLLRRKRELLEQKVQHEYHSQSSNHNYSHLYQDSDSSRSNYGKQSAKKRPTPDDVWSTPPYKRVPRKDNARQFNNDYNTSEKFTFIPATQNSFRRHDQGYSGKASTSNQSFRDMSARFTDVKPFVAQRIVQSKPIQNKQKNFQPTKVTKYKPGDAKKITPGFKYGAKVEAEHYVADKRYPILKPDEVPTQQVAGRLEYALGNIVKTIRHKFENDNLLTIDKTRCIKNIIRQRIRNAMMGKPVGSALSIIARYRELYPEETDIEVVAEANEFATTEEKDKHKVVKSKTYSEDKMSPERYFKRHLTKLLDIKLTEMFGKLRDIYAEERETDIQPLVDNILTAEKMYKESVKSAKNDTELNDSDAVDKDNSYDTIVPNTPNRYTKSYHYEKLMKVLLDRKLPQVLFNFRKNIIKLLNLDKFYVDKKDEILNKTATLLKKQAWIQIDDDDDNITKTTEENKDIVKENDSEPPAPITQRPRLPYYVKIVGRPSLPKRAIMQKFLDQYDPKSIKKVKHMRNLLFVGFDSKDNFDSIVEANNTLIGNNKLIIKISNWVTKDALDTPNDINNPQTTGNESIGDTSLQSIDDQIESLLTEIRQEEDSSKTTQDTEKRVDVLEERAVTDSEQIENDMMSGINEAVLTEEEEASQDNQSHNPNEEIQHIETEKCDEGYEIQLNSGSQEVDENIVQEENIVEEYKATDEINVEDDYIVEGNNSVQENDVVEENDAVEQYNATEDNYAVEQCDATEENYVTVKNEIESDTIDVDDVTQGTNADVEVESKIEAEHKDKITPLKTELKEAGRATPTRSSSRLANVTPSSIRTRRASRLVHDN